MNNLKLNTNVSKLKLNNNVSNSKFNYLYRSDLILNKSGPDIVFMSKYKNKFIEIYGEDHSTLMQKENYYKEIVTNKAINLDEYLILVEHSTLLCEIEPGQHKLFKEAIKRSGSELLFFLKSKSENVVCIDNRMELEFLTAIDEKSLKNKLDEILIFIEKKNNLNLDLKNECNEIFEILGQLFSKFIYLKEYFIRIGELYDKYIYILGEQLKICDMISNVKKMNKEKIRINEDTIITYGYLYVYMLLIILDNCKKLASIAVDIHILDILEDPKNTFKKILIFVGDSHCIRIMDLIKNKNSIIDYTIDDRKLEVLIQIADKNPIIDITPLILEKLNIH
jgi:hypothetical protein